MDALRMVKAPEELALMTRAQQIAAGVRRHHFQRGVHASEQVDEERRCVEPHLHADPYLRSGRRTAL